MHICFITHEYPKSGYPHGGIGSFVRTIAEALIARGIRVSVVGINYTASYETTLENGVTIYRLAKSNRKGIAWWFHSRDINKKIKEIHKQNPIDIVETAELGLAFLTKINNIKYVIRLHGGHHFFAEAENRGINWWKGFQEKRSFKKADAFIAVSEYVKQHTEKYLSYQNKSLVYINNPINTTVFKPLDKQVVKHKIVFAGTVCEKKGVRQLVQAFPIVKAQFPDATLHLYGRDWLYPDGRSYIEMLKEKELSMIGEAGKSIWFHGVATHEEIAKKYAEAAVCIFPSHMETQGLVAPEAMAMGKPVVFTNKGPGPEMIIDNDTGLLCNPLNPRDIADKIIWVFENEVASLKMGKKAQEEVKKRFSLDVLLSKNIDFFLTLVTQKK